MFAWGWIWVNGIRNSLYDPCNFSLSLKLCQNKKLKPVLLYIITFPKHFFYKIISWKKIIYLFVLFCSSTLISKYLGVWEKKTMFKKEAIIINCTWSMILNYFKENALWFFLVNKHSWVRSKTESCFIINIVGQLTILSKVTK